MEFLLQNITYIITSIYTFISACIFYYIKLENRNKEFLDFKQKITEERTELREATKSLKEEISNLNTTLTNLNTQIVKLEVKIDERTNKKGSN